MNQEQMNRMQTAKGFLAALDQSGGSTPKALAQYGVDDTFYTNEEEMYARVHEMRSRIITNPAFSSQYILGAILFENTINGKIKDTYSADYLWQEKGIVPFLKVDKGLAKLENGVQLMKPIPNLDSLLAHAVQRNIFGTKMRSLITEANATGIKNIVDQQFAFALQIAHAGLVPILEPEVDIHSKDKQEAEAILKEELKCHLSQLDVNVLVMFKLSIPTIDGFYSELMDDPRVVRVVALSGGYSQAEANERLAKNPRLIASFSRALSQGLTYQQSEEAFTTLLSTSIQAIYDASIT